MEIVDIAVKDLVPYDKNPRRNDEAAVKVAESSLFTGSVTVSQYLKTSSLDAENVEASTINLVDSYDLSCIDLMPFYGSPDEASLIFHPAHAPAPAQRITIYSFISPTVPAAASRTGWPDRPYR